VRDREREREREREGDRETDKLIQRTTKSLRNPMKTPQNRGPPRDPDSNSDRLNKCLWIQLDNRSSPTDQYSRPACVISPSSNVFGMSLKGG
jgi:hypothetical protein